MARMGGHPEEDLIRYIDGGLPDAEQLQVKNHLENCSHCRRLVAFAREFGGSLSKLPEEALAAREPCPDAWALASYEAGDVDEETARQLRGHLAFCDHCGEAFYALRRARPRTFTYVLRAARGIIERLRSPVDLEMPDQLLPAPAVIRLRGQLAFLAPFSATETFCDPDNGKLHKVTLRVEDCLSPDAAASRFRIVVACEPMPQDWTVSLIGHTEKPFEATPMMIESELPHGFYVLEIAKNDQCIGSFRFTVEHFNAEEALDAATEHLRVGEYRRTLAILESAVSRNPDCLDLRDLQAIALAMAKLETHAAEPESGWALQDEYAEFRLKSFADLFATTWDALRIAATDFSERVALWVAASTIEPSVPLPKPFQQDVASHELSLAALRSMDLLLTRLQATEGRMAELTAVISSLTSRLESFKEFLDGLHNSIDLIRNDVARDVDEKLGAIRPHLERIEQAIRDQKISLAAYEPVFSQALGGPCWAWLGSDVRGITVTAEAVYRYLGSEHALQSPDFSPALLQFCRGFELLLNEKLRDICGELAKTVSKRELSGIVAARFPSIRLDQVLRATGGSFTPTQVANLLVIGKTVCEDRPGSFSAGAESVLSASSGLTGTDFVAPLMFVALRLRNGTAHGLHFTGPDNLHMLRKLLFGLDEHQVGADKLLDDLRSARWWWYGEQERYATIESIKRSWEGFPGLAQLLWSAISTSPGIPV